MKKSELKDYIKSRIRETLYAGAGSIAKAKADPDYAKVKNKPEVDMTLRAGGSVELEEMARKAVVLKVAPDFREKAADIKTGGPISPKKLEDVLNFLDGKKEVTGPEIAAGVGFEGKMPRIYPIYAALINAGAIVSTSEEETVDVPDTPENEDGEALFRFDGETEEPAEEEPSEDEIERAPIIKLDPVSQAAADFTLDNDRLIQSLINAYKESRVRIGEIREEEGDLSAADYKKALKQSKESAVERLDAKLSELVKRLSALEPEVLDKVLSSLSSKFKSVDASNLSKVVSKKLGKDIMPQEEPIETDVVDIDIEDLDDEAINEDSGVEDVDHDDTSFKDYDSVYERMQKLLNYKG
jgi:hypothetical protein